LYFVLSGFLHLTLSACVQESGCESLIFIPSLAHTNTFSTYTIEEEGMAILPFGQEMMWALCYLFACFGHCFCLRMGPHKDFLALLLLSAALHSKQKA
jgi:hypothetical protein